MPKYFEVNTDRDVLCFMPSGRITTDGKVKAQFSQDGGTCWFYSTMMLANAAGFRFPDAPTIEKYKAISAFRKEQSRLDAVVAVAATLLTNGSTSRNQVIIILMTQRLIVKVCTLMPSLAYLILPKNIAIPRQLKNFQADLQDVLGCISRFVEYYPTDRPKTAEAISTWLQERNPYQSRLLEAACTTADRLAVLGCTELSSWSRVPRTLLARAGSPVGPSPSVIILGDTAEATSAHREFSTAEKQTRRTIELKHFNGIIKTQTLRIFGMESNQFSTPQRLMQLLKAHGPVLVVGYYGSAFYTSPAHVLKDSEGKVQTFGSRKLIGWNRSEAKQSFDGSIAHQITIIGCKYNPENPNQSQVIFLDPNNASIPGEQRTAYAISFDRLSRNRLTTYRDEIPAHYSTIIDTTESVFRSQTASTYAVHRIVKFSTLAVLGAGVACLALRAIRVKPH